MKLVLIEGIGKQPSVQKYLGEGYKVVPTFGHVRDLPVKGLGINLLNNFEPEYVISADKKKVVNDITAAFKKADGVLIATDPDREGEAIAWHLATILGLDRNAMVRTAFNEISKKAVNESIANPKPLNYDLINAQQGRRVLDRIVGYKLSPLLWKKVKRGLSAGRVQSVALRLIVDREREILAFNNEAYYKVEAQFHPEGTPEGTLVKATLDTRFPDMAS